MNTIKKVKNVLIIVELALLEYNLEESRLTPTGISNKSTFISLTVFAPVNIVAEAGIQNQKY